MAGLSCSAAQVLAEQCRRLGVDVEASSSQTAALAQASNGATVSKKKPSWNLDISSIHRRIKDDIRNSSSSSRVQASGAASESPEQLPLPPGWEVSNCSMQVMCHLLPITGEPVIAMRPVLDCVDGQH